MYSYSTDSKYSICLFSNLLLKRGISVSADMYLLANIGYQ